MFFSIRWKGESSLEKGEEQEGEKRQSSGYDGENEIEIALVEEEKDEEDEEGGEDDGGK